MARGSGQLHKKETLNLTKAKIKQTQTESLSQDPAVGKKNELPRKSALPLKWFVVVMSVGLVLTTFLGIYMAFRFAGAPRLVWGILAAGTFLPMAMIFF